LSRALLSGLTRDLRRLARADPSSALALARRHLALEFGDYNAGELLRRLVTVLDARALEVRRSDIAEVEAFTVEPSIAEVIKDEICEELTVVGNEPDSEGLTVSDA